MDCDDWMSSFTMFDHCLYAEYPVDSVLLKPGKQSEWMDTLKTIQMRSANPPSLSKLN